MTRNKALLSLLTVLLVLAVVIVPLFVIDVQISITLHSVSGDPIATPAGAAALAVPDVLACEGCSGGGGGPF